jgi:hypothetical protein
MLLDALKFLTDIISKAETPKKIDVADPRKLFFAVGGGVEQVELPPPPRDHKPGTLAEVIALANRFQEAGATPTVWHDERQVVLVIDDDGHRVERATLAFEFSDFWRVLHDLANRQTWLDQKSFVRLLKIQLAGTLPPGVLLDRVRKLKFEGGQVVTSRIGRADESMGRSISNAVSGEGEIPDDVEVEVPVYRTPGETERFVVRCSIEIDASKMDAFRFLPWPDELQRVESLAVSSVGERLAEGLSEGIPAYQGQP